MNKTLTTVLIVLAILALAGGVFAAGTFFGRSQSFAPYGFGPGMMGGRGYGMMSGRGYGMMGGYAYNNTAAAPLTVDQARAAAQKYVTALNNADLTVGEVMIFSNNAYAVVTETSTGKGAFELLVDPGTQVAYPEHGANMMWNLKYGAANHTSMMGGYGWSNNPPAVDAQMTVTPEQAIQYAQKYLDANLAGATAADDPTQFYGYYTLDFSKDGKVAGMLSVNGFSGQILLHTWHDQFIQEAE